MWKCIINNPSCSDGWVIENGEFVGTCNCVRVKAVAKAYNEFGGFDANMRKQFSSLEDNNIREFDYFNNQTKGVHSYKELGNKIVENLPRLIELNAKLYLYGDPGSGKSQFVSSLAFEGAWKHEAISYYLPSIDLWDAVFDFGDRNKTKLNAIREKALHPSVKVLIIDDMGAEVPKGDGRLFELCAEYNKIIRQFQKDKNGMIIITSNLDPSVLSKNLNDPRLTAVIFQQGNTKFYEFSRAKNFRNDSPNKLDFLD